MKNSTPLLLFFTLIIYLNAIPQELTSWENQIGNGINNNDTRNNIIRNESYCKKEMDHLRNLSQFRLVSHIRQVMQSDTLINERKDDYLYGDNNKLINHINQVWQNGGWKNKMQETFTYHENEIQCLIQSFTSTWVDKARYFSTYNSNGQILEYLYQEYGGSTGLLWLDDTTKVFIYDENGNLIERVQHNFDNGSLVGYSQKIFDSVGNIILEISKRWMWEDGILHPYLAGTYKVLNTYNPNGSKTESLKQTWENSDWLNSEKIEYSYESNGKLYQELASNWKNNTWETAYRNVYKREYYETYDIETMSYQVQYEYGNEVRWGTKREVKSTYNKDGKITKVTSNTSVIKYSYDSQGRITSKWEQKTPESSSLPWWIEKHDYAYDSYGNLIEYIHKKWDSGGFYIQWEYINRYVYDKYGNKIKYHYQVWQKKDLNTARHQVTYQDDIYIYESVSSVDKHKQIKIPKCFELTNFPNPFNSSTRIQFELSESAITEIKIFNILGKFVKTIADKRRFDKGKHSIVWDGTDNSLSPVSSGIYVYMLQFEDARLTNRMLLIK